MNNINEINIIKFKNRKINYKIHKIYDMNEYKEISKYIKIMIDIESMKDNYFTLYIRNDNSWYVCNLKGYTINKGSNFEKDITMIINQ